MGGALFAITPAILLIMLRIGASKAELTPPYFNLAEGRKISASATCGENTDEPELYCKLVGANTENEESYYSLIQGQVREKFALSV
jgi:laminin alpha 3/5